MTSPLMAYYLVVPEGFVSQENAELAQSVLIPPQLMEGEKRVYVDALHVASWLRENGYSELAEAVEFVGRT